MDTDYVIDFMSSEWIVANSISLIYLICCLLVGRFSTKKFRYKFAYFFVLIFIINYFLFHIIHIVEGSWNINSRLPLHLCGISSLITCFILFVKKKQPLFDFLFYAGILGGINALLTPLIDDYSSQRFFYFDYFYSHTSIIIFPLYMYYYLDMKLSKFSWLKSFAIINILLLIIMPIDFIIDANYMYLKDPPAVDHPFVSGNWPYYLINLEFIVFFLFYFTYQLFKIPLLKNNLNT